MRSSSERSRGRSVAPCDRPRALLGVAALAAVALGAEAPLRNWGSTREERERPLPGDGVVPGERGATTMATTIAAPPAAIWPWLAQMGADRGAALDLRGRPFDPEGLRPRWYSESRWEFFLDPRPDGSTRLLVRSGGAGSPRRLSHLADRLFWQPVHVVMQLRQFGQIRRRAESHAASRVSA